MHLKGQWSKLLLPYTQVFERGTCLITTGRAWNLGLLEGGSGWAVNLGNGGAEMEVFLPRSESRNFCRERRAWLTRREREELDGLRG